MPSNAELKASIEELSAELGVETVTDGLTNAQLADKLSDLRDEKTKRAAAPAPDTQAEADAAAQAQAEADAAAQALDALMAPAVVAKPPYYMAPGKAVTSKAGILSGDTADEVKVEYFEGGDETLQALVESGYVLKS